MKTLDTPANNNISFTELMHNPKRDLAYGSMEQTVELLLAARVPQSLIAEMLFDQLSQIVMPNGKLTGESATTWYAQLQRMQTGIQGQIEAIETAIAWIDGDHRH